MSHAELLTQLEARLGKVHARARLGLEREHEDQVFRTLKSGARSIFHPENWYSLHRMIPGMLQMAGMYRRAQRNARTPRLVHHTASLRRLPGAFRGYRILHLSDLHIDVSDEIAHAIIEAVRASTTTCACSPATTASTPPARRC
jgi:uncharacterized protein